MTRRTDQLTCQVLLDWVTFRRGRWPHTANPHLSTVSAQGTGPISTSHLHNLPRPSGITLDQLRIDRQLEEALTHGPDPLHLARIFGLSDTTAIRYAYQAKPCGTDPG